MDQEGHEVRRLVDDRELAGDAKHRVRWDGRDDEGRLVPDGIYRMRVLRRDEGRVIDSQKQIKVDRRPPRVVLTSARPERDRPGRARPAARGADPLPRAAQRGARVPRLPHRRRPAAARAALPRRRGRAGRLGRAAARGQARAGGRLRLHGPGARPRRQPDRGPARRSRARAPRGRAPACRCGPSRSRGRWPWSRPARWRACGSGPSTAPSTSCCRGWGRRARWCAGERIGGSFRVRVPRRTRTGVYLVRVRAGDRRAVWPLAVAGLPQTQGSAARPRPLVVLPALTWQGLNPVDDDHDGFADTLPGARRVPLEREFAGGGLPPGFRSESAPLLRFLDRARLDYDLTTDLSLARGEGPALGNAPGRGVRGKRALAAAGARAAAARLRGGRRAARLLRRGRLPPQRPARPRRRSGRRRRRGRANVFGERTGPAAHGRRAARGVRGRRSACSTASAA